MKQDPFANVYRALTPKELAEMLMNPNAPKSEAEHWAVREIERLRAEVERLREALSFYADENRYKTTTVHMCGHATGQAVMLDRGSRARKALKGAP